MTAPISALGVIRVCSGVLLAVAACSMLAVLGGMLSFRGGVRFELPTLLAALTIAAGVLAVLGTVYGRPAALVMAYRKAMACV